MAAVLDAALAYAARGWPVFPMGADKKPLTSHGRSDATIDPAKIRGWAAHWPRMLIAVATGAESGVVALDLDIDETGLVNGIDSLDEIGITHHLATATAHTPRGGVHLLFRHPGAGVYVKTIAGKLGPGIDIRGDGGSLILPPGPGRWWDPHLGVDTPLAAMPAWMVAPEPAPKPVPKPARDVRLTRYGERALDGAVRNILAAPAGQQHQTLNREAYGIGQLVAGGVIPAGLALESLQWAARQMPSYDRRRSWRAVELDRHVRDAFLDGQLKPRQVA